MRKGGKMLQLFSINERTSPIEIRERFVLTDEQKIDLNNQLKKSGIENVIILSTCQRFEIYFSAGENWKECIKEHVIHVFKINPSTFNQYVLHLKEKEAYLHLYRVTLGLESIVKGETQILGQVKRSYQASQEAGLIQKTFHFVFQSLFRFSKQMHRQFGINNHSVSLSHVSYALAKDTIKRPITFLILGAGEMGRLLINHALQDPLDHLILLNRSEDKLRAFDRYDRVRTGALDQWSAYLDRADVVVSTIETNTPLVIEASHFNENKPRLIIDLGLPRSLKVSYPNDAITVLNLDDLKSQIDRHRFLRESKGLAMEKAIEKEVDRLRLEAEHLKYDPIIQQLSEEKTEHLERLMKSITDKCPDLGSDQIAIIKMHLHAALNLEFKAALSQLKSGMVSIKSKDIKTEESLNDEK